MKTARHTSEFELEAVRLIKTDQSMARGSRYRSLMFKVALKAYGMRSSMIRKGDCRDNSPTESLWNSLKVVRIQCKIFSAGREAKD